MSSKVSEVLWIARPSSSFTPMKFWAYLRHATVSKTGVTDNEWFPFLAARGLDEVNFWRPT
jgi:hypothetical protein